MKKAWITRWLWRLEDRLDALERDRRPSALARLADRLHQGTARLARAVRDAGGALTPDDTSDRDAEMTREREDAMSAEMDRLTEEVRQNRTVMESATTLLGTLARRVRDTAGDADAANRLADELDANTGTLAQAVTANTPAEGEPAPAPQSAQKKRP